MTRQSAIKPSAKANDKRYRVYLQINGKRTYFYGKTLSEAISRREKFKCELEQNSNNKEV